MADIEVPTHPGSALAQRLRLLADRVPSGRREGAEPPYVSAIVARRRERIAELATPAVGLVVVLQGTKHVCRGARSQSYGPGDTFLLPAGSRVDVVNEPDEKHGIYRALFLCFSRDLVIEAARLWPEFAGPSVGDSSVTLTSNLCEAILGAGEALAKGSRRLIRHRLLEVILILAEGGSMRLTPKYVDRSVVEGVRLLVRHKLDHLWTGGAVAASFGMSEATLRRRLREEGSSLRELLRAERMLAAHVLLCDRDAQVEEAAAATGYASRSHFGRHFRDAFGVTPAAARMGRGTAKSV